MSFPPTDPEETLNRRNTEAVRQALEGLTAKLYALQERVNALVATMGTLTERMGAVERLVALETARSFGHGPTET